MDLVSFASYLQISLAIASLHLKRLNIPKSEQSTHLIQQTPRPLTELLRVLKQALLRCCEQRWSLRRRLVLRRRHAGVRDRSEALGVCRAEVVEE